MALEQRIFDALNRGETEMTMKDIVAQLQALVNGADQPDGYHLLAEDINRGIRLCNRLEHYFKQVPTTESIDGS